MAPNSLIKPNIIGRLMVENKLKFNLSEAEVDNGAGGASNLL